MTGLPPLAPTDLSRISGSGALVPTPSGTPPEVSDGWPGRRLLGLMLTLALVAGLLLAAFLHAGPRDPYSRAVLALKGDDVSGGKLFRLNCAGCHGLAAQGLVGPNLHGVDHRKNDRQLIQQVISGRTPPMPRFQLDPQDMADLLAFLHRLA